MEPQPTPRKRRTSVVRIRVTASERSALEAAAAEVGLGISSLVRYASIKAIGLTPTPAPKRPRDDLARQLAAWIGQLARIGNNVNQVARVANTGGAVPATFAEATIEELRALRRVVLNATSEGRDE